MNKQKENLRSVVAETLGVPRSEVAYDTGPGDINEWDSLGHVRVITALESYYDLALDDDQLFEIESVEDLCRNFLGPDSQDII